MLDGHLAQVSQDVLHQGVLDGALLAAHLVEALPVGHQVVDDANDDDDSQRVQPDDDNGNNVDVAIGAELGVGRGGGLQTLTSEPTETGKQRGEDIDTEDGADELPRGVGLEATGDEDQPVLSESDLEEDDLLDTTVVLDETTSGQVEVPRRIQVPMASRAPRTTEMIQILGSCHSTGRFSK